MTWRLNHCKTGEYWNRTVSNQYSGHYMTYFVQRVSAWCHFLFVALFWLSTSILFSFYTDSVTSMAGRKTISCEEKWVRIFKHFSDQKKPLSSLVKVTKSVGSIPAECFSVMSNVYDMTNWLDTFLQNEPQLACMEFHKKLKISIKFLRKCIPKKYKYVWKNSDNPVKDFKCGSNIRYHANLVLMQFHLD